MASVRGVVEQEIGLPQLPVSGATKNAYFFMTRLAANVLAKQMGKHPESLQQWYYEQTGRIKRTKMCNQFAAYKYRQHGRPWNYYCETKPFSTTNWSESAVAQDFSTLTKWFAENRNTGDANISKDVEGLKRDSLLCGEFCCEWRKQQGLPCHLNYNENPFDWKLSNKNADRVKIVFYRSISSLLEMVVKVIVFKELDICIRRTHLRRTLSRSAEKYRKNWAMYFTFLTFLGSIYAAYDGET